MKVLIIEDEAPAYRRLTKLIAECDSSAQVVGIIQSVKEGLAWFKSNPLPDLILSDIQLADDLSFSIFKELSITTPIIFITAFDEYAINAFKFYSIDYLLKPINVDDLKKSIEKYRNFQVNKPAHNFEELIDKLVQKKYRERFLVYSGNVLIPISCSDIAYFLSEDGASMLVTHADKRFFIAESLDTVENDLNPTDFFRANRQYIISSRSIQKIHNFGNQKLKLIIKPDIEEGIIISKLKATAFKEWLNR